MQNQQSRSDLNNLGISPKAAKFKNKTAKLLAQQQRKGSMIDLSNSLMPTGKPGGAQPRKSLNSGNNRYEKYFSHNLASPLTRLEGAKMKFSSS